MEVAGNSSPAKSQLWAVLVGVGRYGHDDFSALEGAARDACLIYDALQRTHLSATEVRPTLLMTGGDVAPSRGAILDALRRVAREAADRDTVLVFLSGHGVLLEEQASFVPEDGNPSDADSLLSLEAVQRVFEQCACPRRALLLDMCQAEPGSVHAKADMSSVFADAVHVAERGWTILTSCGPGQRSFESPELNGHGIFSYYVALALRGEADLDCDGTVGLGELAQYVSNKVPWEARRYTEGFREQVPELICRGRIDPMTDPGAASIKAAPAERREFEVPTGIGRDWLQIFLGGWPFERVTVWNWLIRGAALLYAAVMSLEVLLLSDSWTGLTWFATAGVGLLSGALWHAVISFSIASATRRYHHGGYLGAAALVAWHVGVFAGCSFLSKDTTHLVHFGVDVFFVLVCMIVFGMNALHIVISILDLERRREEGHLRDFFAAFEKKLLRVEFPNPIPCETFHPKLYLAVWPLITIFLLAHVGNALSKEPLSIVDGLVVLRDLVIWVLVTWFISGNFGMYRTLFRRHPKRVIV